jgi:DNA-binding NtrC family response regulator
MEALKVKTRVIAATNIGLRQAMEKGAFRDDLFYRLNGVTIEIPPLRERGTDIELLAHYYLKKFSREYARPRMEFSQDALISIANYSWPGNVRELMSAVGRAVALARRNIIRPADLDLEDGCQNEDAAQTLAEAREDFDRSVISKCLARNQHNVQRTAEDLGISRVALYRLMKRYGVTRPNQGGRP